MSICIGICFWGNLSLKCQGRILLISCRRPSSNFLEFVIHLRSLWTAPQHRGTGTTLPETCIWASLRSHRIHACYRKIQLEFLALRLPGKTWSRRSTLSAMKNLRHTDNFLVSLFSLEHNRNVLPGTGLWCSSTRIWSRTQSGSRWEICKTISSVCKSWAKFVSFRKWVG